MVKKIVLFNHKGGVSKTTTTFHLGWMIAKMGHKVLLVDADPQCNLTSLFLGNSFDSYYDEEITKNCNIMDGVRPAFDGNPTPIQAVNCPEANRNGSLFLLPGHMNLSEYDAQLNFALNASMALSSLKSLPGAFNDLINKCADKYNVEYVFIDLNPGLSAINQDLFLISDAFIIPTNPDTFSLMALKSLARILPKWVAWKRNNIIQFEDSAYPLTEGWPKFIGEIAQRFNIRNGSPTAPYKTKISELSDIVISTLLPSLSKNGMLFLEEQYEKADIKSDKMLAEIKDFQGLSPKSQGANVPVYELTDEELQAKGAALDGMKSNRQFFNDVYKDLANKIICILS